MRGCHRPLHQHPLERRRVSRLKRARGVRPVKRHQPRFDQDRQVHRRDVAVADERFRIRPDHGVIEQRQNPARTVPAAQREDSPHLGIGEERVDVLRALLVAAREIAVALSQIFSRLDLESLRGEPAIASSIISGFSGGLAGAAMPMVSPGASRGGKRSEGALMAILLENSSCVRKHEQF